MKTDACRLPGNTGNPVTGWKPGNTETVLLPGRAAALAASMRAEMPGTRRRITISERAVIIAAQDAVSSGYGDRHSLGGAPALVRRLLLTRAVLRLAATTV